MLLIFELTAQSRCIVEFKYAGIDGGVAGAHEDCSTFTCSVPHHLRAQPAYALKGMGRRTTE